MEPKLKNISKSYHRFVNDQVLTADKLNNVITHFDEQQRLSRVFLSGVGLVCGFKVRANGSVFISPGIGVTSDGDLIQFRKVGVSNNTEKIETEEIEFSHCRLFADKNAQYSRFISGEDETTMEMWELLPTTELDVINGTNEVFSIENMDLNDKVLVLYLESYAYKGDLCTAIDCDSQGEEQREKLRVLMMSEYNAQILAENDTVFKWHNITEQYTSLPEIKAPRVNLYEVDSLDKIRKSFYQTLHATVLNKLKNAFDTIFGIFGKPSVSGKINKLLLFTLNEFAELQDFQYRYDLSCDLIDTYNEIKSLLLQINAECAPSVSAFPKHLMLGKIISETDYPVFRHRTYKSPLSKTESSNRKKVNTLINRVVQMLDCYSVQIVSSTQNIKILPSKISAALGNKTIPYYYHINTSFLKTWSYEKTSNFNEKYNLCYHVRPLANEPEIRQPLNFENDKHKFYRIEGHLGLNGKASVDKITNDIQKYGLNINCILLDLDDKNNAFSKFVKKHTGLQHQSGVTEGGTFIIIVKNNETIADFSLPYKISVEKEVDCCSLMECSYPWISSLKYLNNLARSTKGTQSRTKFMPKKYVLQVVEYKINGQPLIDSPKQVSVDLQDIYKRRMHAVTNALNKQFSKGVVFDFNESQKRFLITRAKEDRYTIRLRDITYQRGGAIYTFSNNGMFRNNVVFRAGAMQCRDLKAYNPNFYEKLQQTIAPQHKDDDYGKFYKKWAKWYRLKDRLVNNSTIETLELNRTITKVSELPSEIQSQLRQLKLDFNQVSEKDLNFKLDGDWVTGEWVNKDMLDYFRQNKTNDDDEIVAFIKLRKFLHSETGVTKLSLYITNVAYTEAFDGVIKQYKTFADIYFGTPRGEFVINV